VNITHRSDLLSKSFHASRSSGQEEWDVGAERFGHLEKGFLPDRRRAEELIARRRAVAASELPPPNPACIGIRFASVMCSGKAIRRYPGMVRGSVAQPDDQVSLVRWKGQRGLVTGDLQRNPTRSFPP